MKIIKCHEERIYYRKNAQIPFKAKVKLIAKIYFENGYKMGIFEYNGRRFNCPLRILRRDKNERI